MKLYLGENFPMLDLVFGKYSFMEYEKGGSFKLYYPIWFNCRKQTLPKIVDTII